MDLSKIKVGDHVRNYPKMCALLSVDERGGSPKDRQIEDWKRYINFTKDKHEFIIIEIYPVEKPKIDNRTNGNNSKYVQHTSLLLLSYLLEDCSYYGTTTTVFYNKDIKTTIGLCNDRFIDKDESFFNELYDDEDSSITKYDKNNFYQRADNKIREIIKATIKQLNKDSFIDIKETFIVSEKNSKETNRIATDKEDEIINSVNKAILKRFYKISLFAIYARNLEEQYYERVAASLLSKHKLIIKYKAIHITFNEDVNTLKDKYTLTEESRVESINIVNNTIHEFLDSQAQKNVDKQHKEELKFEAEAKLHREQQRELELERQRIKENKPRSFATPTSSIMTKGIYKYHPNYIKNQKYLSSLLIFN